MSRRRVAPGFGAKGARWARALAEADPLADAVAERFACDPAALGLFHRALAGWPERPTVPAEIAALLDEVGVLPHPPPDTGALARGGRLFFRAGVTGGLALGSGSLVGGYSSPEGNKPLVRSRRLLDDVPRRLAETATFVVAVHRLGGALPGGEGWRLAVHVRVMHAQVRRRLRLDPTWDPDWGLPLNQHDLAGTLLLFSTVWVRGVRRLGLDVTRAEAEDHLALWRLMGRWMGVAPDLVPRDEADALASVALVEASEGTPDDDARQLVRALLDSAPPGPTLPLRRAFAEAVVRHIQGPERADPLGVPAGPGRFLVPLILLGNRPLAPLARRSRRIEARLVADGERYWQTTGGAGVHFPFVRA